MTSLMHYGLRACVAGLAALAAHAPAESPLFLTAPYLQNPKPDGITIMWEAKEASPYHLHYGTSAEDEKPAEITHEDSGAKTLVYKAVISGLAADTSHQYRITVEGGTRPAAEGWFRTAPDTPRPFAFGVWSDSQGPNKGAYPDDLYEPTKTLLAHLAGSGVEFGIAAGDLAEDGDSYTETKAMYLDRVAKHFGQSTPWFVAWGNHDGKRGDPLRKFADMPSKDREGHDPGWGSYTFEYAGVFFMCIEYTTMEKDIPGWVETQLASEAAQNAKFRFVTVHVPPFCELWIDGEEMLREKLVPLLEKHRVDVCFSGHTHEYERGFLNGVYYCITGGGSWLDFGEPVVKDWPHMSVGGAHDLPGFQHGLVNEYVRVMVEDDHWVAEMHGFKPNGDYIGVLDTFRSVPRK
jgi:predicted phosphodiesterase